MSSPEHKYQLESTFKFSIWGGPFMMLLGTGFIWAGTVDFKTSDTPWVIGLCYVVLMLIISPVLYFSFRKESPLWVNGIMAFLSWIVPAACVFGMAAHFFYFAYAPMPSWASWLGIYGGAALMLHWGYKCWNEVMVALHPKGLYSQAYLEEAKAFYYSWDFMQKLEDTQKYRDPFKSYHMWFAIAISPFVLVLNRMLTPFTGSGHGVFLVMSFLGLPFTLWIIGHAVRVYILMLHYPIKIQRATGKPVLMRDWI
jgi:hypothetical protein